MAQLTLEKAKELLKKLQYAKAQMGQLSLNDEMYKQALEIAISMLEKQDRVNDEWIVWPGGNCPIDKNKVVYVKFRDGDADNNGAKAGTMDWFHFGEAWDIIAYRLVKP